MNVSTYTYRGHSVYRLDEIAQDTGLSLTQVRDLARRPPLRLKTHQVASEDIGLRPGGFVHIIKSLSGDRLYRACVKLASKPRQKPANAVWYERHPLTAQPDNPNSWEARFRRDQHAGPVA